jgi:hypothetical protein
MQRQNLVARGGDDGEGRDDARPPRARPPPPDADAAHRGRGRGRGRADGRAAREEERDDPAVDAVDADDREVDPAPGPPPSASPRRASAAHAASTAARFDALMLTIASYSSSVRSLMPGAMTTRRRPPRREGE